MEIGHALETLCEICGVLYHSAFHNEHVAGREHNLVFEEHFVMIESAAQCRIVTFVANNPNNILSVEEYLEKLRQNVIYLLRHYQNIHNSLKYNMILDCTFYKDNNFQRRSFKTPNAVVFALTDIDYQYTCDIRKLLIEKHDLEMRGTGWTLVSVTRLELRINKYEPIFGGSISTRFEIPKFIVSKKCIVNPFRYYKTNTMPECCKNLCFKYAIMGKILFDAKINYHSIPNYFRFENLNNKYDWSNISFPVKLDSIEVFEKRNMISINLYGVDEKKKIIYPIKVTRTRKTDHRDILYYKNHYCWIKNFEGLINLQLVKKKRQKLFVCRMCFKHFNNKDILLNHESNCSKDPILTFPSHGTNFIYFKNFHRQMKVPYIIYADIDFKLEMENICLPNPNISYLQNLGMYKAVEFKYCLVFKGLLKYTKTFSNIEDFIKSLDEECLRISSEYKKNVPAEGLFPSKPVSGELCHICLKPMLNSSSVALDHDHMTGVIRGYTHSVCNINFRLPNFVPIFIKDLTKCNSSLILNYFLKQNPSTGKLSVIPCNENLNTFMSLIKRNNKFNMRFVDSSKFLDTDDKLTFTEHIERFQNLRDICYKSYGLDLAHYISLGSYSWDVMLRITGVKLQLLQDLEMYNLIKAGIRGGSTQCVKRYAKANNKSCLSSYDSKIEQSYIFNLDVISLYSKIMRDYTLPLDSYEWVIQPENIDPYKENEPGIGMILEVDLEYPEHLRLEHVDFPMCPHHILDYGLVATFKNKNNYVIHHHTLLQSLKMGLKITKIHRAIRFRETRWLSNYIDLNIQLRKQYFHEKWLGDTFKKMANLIYGKSIQKDEKYLNTHILKSNPYKLVKLIKQSTFQDRTILDENTYIVFMKKAKVKITKPIPVGMAILDISKSYMYNLFYNELKKRLPKFDLLYFDTDNFVLQIFTEENIIGVLENCSDIIHLKPEMGEVGLLRDQCLGSSIIEFVGLRSKVYGYICENKKSVKKNLPNTFDFGKFHSLLKAGNFNETQNTTSKFKRVIGNDIFQVIVNKKIPSVGDDRKRVICSNGINTMPLF